VTSVPSKVYADRYLPLRSILVSYRYIEIDDWHQRSRLILVVDYDHSKCGMAVGRLHNRKVRDEQSAAT
jgi:hypothetical protein